MNRPIYLVSEVARRLKIQPRTLSDLFYQRQLDDDRCPVVGGRRIIPADYLPEIEAVIRARGKLKGKGKTNKNRLPTA